SSHTWARGGLTHPHIAARGSNLENMSQLGVMDEGKIVSQVGALCLPAIQFFMYKMRYVLFLVDKRIAFGSSTYPLPMYESSGLLVTKVAGSNPVCSQFFCTK